MAPARERIPRDRELGAKIKHFRPAVVPRSSRGHFRNGSTAAVAEANPFSGVLLFFREPVLGFNPGISDAVSACQL